MPWYLAISIEETENLKLDKVGVLMVDGSMYQIYYSLRCLVEYHYQIFEVFVDMKLMDDQLRMISSWDTYGHRCLEFLCIAME